MIQSFETQLQVSLRALGEIVAPALAGADKHVIEQLHLVMAALGFMSARLSSAATFQRAELEGYIALAEEAAANFRQHRGSDCEPLVEAVSAARSALVSSTAEADCYQRSTRRLRELVAALIGQSTSEAEAADLQALVLARSGEMLSDARLWCLPLGFELDPDALPQRDWLKIE
ncbi:hypothetical protein [Sphingomonas sp.]|uniref:hypothetical protein n=1 Tax=Sphingomonas sp. TaxID=28214 RepID=UPI00325FD52A